MYKKFEKDDLSGAKDIYLRTICLPSGNELFQFTNEKIILIGAGGHCKSCIVLLKKINYLKYPELLIIIKVKILNYKIIGRDKNLKVIFKNKLCTSNCWPNKRL